jgi:uncharacterized phage protein (TIGR01671 family)
MKPKFRAWIKEQKQMVKVNKIDFLNYEGTPDLIICYESDGQTYGAFPEDYELMMSTGEEDKNGKEVWEGDIVRNSLGSLYIIRWDNHMLGFKGEPLYVIQEVEEAYISELEALGNIYENQELLGGER